MVFAIVKGERSFRPDYFYRASIRHSFGLLAITAGLKNAIIAWQCLVLRRHYLSGNYCSLALQLLHILI